MQERDAVIVATADARNALEAFIYDTRSKLSPGTEFAKFATAAESAALGKALGEQEEWLYSDEGYDSPERTYRDHLKVSVL